MDTFQIQNLPAVDQAAIKRGLCPWCLARLTEVENGLNKPRLVDYCAECNDMFIGKLTINI